MAEKKKFYIVFNSRGEDRKLHGAHVVSSVIPGTQELLENKFTPAETNLECEFLPTTRYLLREKKGGADNSTLSSDWANYVIDHTEEATPYDTFEAAEEALNG